MFPGGGAHYVGMAAGLDDRFDVFHEVMRDGRRSVCTSATGWTSRRLLRPDASPDALRKATASLPAVFLTSVAARPPVDGVGRDPERFRRSQPG